jgi:hypothetical protein
VPRARHWPERIAGSRLFRWSAGAAVAAAAVLLLVMIADVVVDRPLRRTLERRINAALTGYRARVGEVDAHLLNFSIDLEKVTILQIAHPDPPVATIPRLHASVQWKALLTGHLVGDVVFEQPVIHADLAQLSSESRDEVPLHRRGWQDALQAIYPLKINALEVYDATVVYQDEGDYRPLRLSHVRFHADNIRNVRSEKGTYPSDVHLAGNVFDHGFLVVDGGADFLAEDFPAVRAHLRVSDMDLEYFDPVTRRINLLVNGGRLGASGEFEFAADTRVLDLEAITVEGARIDYFHTAQTAAVEEQRRHAASDAAKRIATEPGTLVRIQKIDVLDSEFGYRNDATSPPYRLFMTHSRLELRNLASSQGTQPAMAALTGHFMGDAVLRARASFRPGERPDFDVKVALDDGRLERLNDLLRAYAKLDVVSGRFSIYSEVRVKDGQMSGYVKPLFHDVDVYNARQDKGKNLFKKAYEAIAGGIAKLLQNRKREETATVTTISGPVENARADTAEIIGGLIRNAFFDAILPGFEGSVKPGKDKGKEPRDRGRKDKNA